MRLDDYIEDLEPEAAVERRRLAEQKSYEVLDYVEGAAEALESVRSGDRLAGTAPSVFVGRSNYPDVSAGILAPVADDEDPAAFATSSEWYSRGLDIGDVLQYRGGLLNSSRSGAVNVHDVWDGFVGTQREVAIADDPVAVEIGLEDVPDLDFSLDDVRTPTGPRARAESAELGEDPNVPRPVQKTLEDDDWRAEGAMTYLYREGFDVYEVNRVLSAGALGRGVERRLVPTRWSITAVDDTVGQYLRGQIRHNPQLDRVEVWANEYLGNRYWVVLAPGRWEFELVEMKAPGSVWNPREGETWLASAHEGYEGRTTYVEETAGAYYAARLAVLEHLQTVGRQAKALVLREVSDDYWAPVGVWQVRESVRNAFEGEPGEAERFHGAVETIAPRLPVSLGDLRRKSEMVAGLQSELSAF
ncbi:MAG: DNA repair protein NreA [Halobacteriaceae archaeon]